MKGIIFSALLFILLPACCVAQQSASPLYLAKVAVIDTIPREYPNILQIISQRDIEEMNVFKSDLAIKLYGDRGKNGVIILTLSKSSNLLTAKELLAKYNIDQKYLKLPLLLDSTILKDGKNLYFSADRVASVTRSGVNNKPDEIYINTIKEPKLQVDKAPQFHIRGPGEF